MSDFQHLLARAETLLSVESNGLNAEWWRGYMRGLRRAQHGAKFGTEAEHAALLRLPDSDDAMLVARGHGYAAGLAMQESSP